MAIVVTGASGHIGGNLVRTLVERGERVRAVVHRDDRALRGLDVERVSADVTDAAAVRNACKGASLIYHLAAYISIDGGHGGAVERVNVGGTANVAEAALAEGVRMVHVSSIHAMQQEPKHAPLDETRARVPWGDRRWPAYDQTKAEGERVVRRAIERGLDATILHPTGVIGPHDYAPSRLGLVFLQLYRRTLPSLIDGGFDWVDVRDVVHALIAASDPAKARCNESYLLTGAWKSVAEIAATASSITGVAPPRLATPMWLAQVGAPFMTAWARVTGAEPLYTHESLEALQSNRDMRSEKAKSELGFAPRPFERSVYETYLWHRDVGNLPADAALREPAAG
jgi:dihydroflavonol-4-reductase